MEECERGKRPIFARKLAGRGMAVGDFDNDGSADVLVAQNDDARADPSGKPNDLPNCPSIATTMVEGQGSWK